MCNNTAAAITAKKVDENIQTLCPQVGEVAVYLDCTKEMAFYSMCVV